MEDFNVDTQEWFPNQRIDGDPDECVAITVTDILGDKDYINYSPDFTYAKTLQLEGSTPTTAGSDPWSGMLSAVGYGVLPMSDADFTALTKGELYVSNWQNYSQEDTKTALTHAQNGARRISLDLPIIFKETKANYGVALPMTWYSSFLNPNSDGTVTISGSYTNHMTRVVGKATRNNLDCPIIKPWLGKKYGWGGYLVLTPSQFAQCAKDAFVFDPTANRFFSLLGIALTKFPFLVDFIPQLIKNAPK